MIRSSILYIAPPHLMAGPVQLLRVSGDLLTVRAHGTVAEWQRSRLQRARLWVAKGRDAWLGPFTSWRAAMAAVEALADDPGDVAAIVKGLAVGRGSERGANVLAGGWRYRVAWGGMEPPDRY